MSQQAQASYIEQIGGYIADNPNIDFERCGQGNYPLAFIETDKA